MLVYLIVDIITKKMSSRAIQTRLSMLPELLMAKATGERAVRKQSIKRSKAHFASHHFVLRHSHYVSAPLKYCTLPLHVACT